MDPTDAIVNAILDEPGPAYASSSAVTNTATNRSQTASSMVRPVKIAFKRPLTRSALKVTPRHLLLATLGSGDEFGQQIGPILRALVTKEEEKSIIKALIKRGRRRIPSELEGGIGAHMGNFSVTLASGTVLSSQLHLVKQQGVRKVLLDRPIKLGGGYLQIMGMTLKITFDSIKLDSFGYSTRDAVYMRTTETDESDTKRAHLLHLLIDEMAYELVKFKQQINKRFSDWVDATLGHPLYEGVKVVLQDAWSPKPPKQIDLGLPWSLVFDNIVTMNSYTRNILLTGIPSYYSQFAFIGNDVENLDEPSIDDVVRFQENRIQKLQEWYNECMSQDEFDRDQKKSCELFKSDVLGIMYEKHFVPGAPIVFIGGRAKPENIITYSFDEYYENVIKKGRYPKLKTMPPEAPRVHVGEYESRQPAPASQTVPNLD
jgi:hypothetical protein